MTRKPPKHQSLHTVTRHFDDSDLTATTYFINQTDRYVARRIPELKMPWWAWDMKVTTVEIEKQ
jgi:hypothetical protein